MLTGSRGVWNCQGPSKSPKPKANCFQSRRQPLGRLSRSKKRPGKKWQSRPVSRVLSWTVIPLGATSPLRSSNLPGDTAGRGIVSLFGLAPGGVCRAGLLPDSRCALTAPFQPCHARLSTPFGGLLSVALSVGSRRPGVTWHRALWSPDFPRHPHAPRCMWMTRLPGRLRRRHCRMRGADPAQPLPYRDLRGAPLSSAASLAAVDGGRCSPSNAYNRRPSISLASTSSAAPSTISTNSPRRWFGSA